MFISFDDMQHFGTTRLEAVRTTANSTSKGLQAIADEATDYSKKSFDSTRAFAEKLLEIRKPDEFMSCIHNSRRRRMMSSSLVASVIDSECSF